MATPPTYVGEYESVWNNTTSPKTSASITTQVGDVLVVAAMSADSSGPLVTPTNTGTAQTWAPQQSVVVGSYATAYCWTTVATVAQTMTVSVTKTGPTQWWGFNVLHWRDSDGVGASSKTNVTNGAPSLGLTTTTDNAAIVVLNSDWAAVDGTSRTWRSVNGSAATENTYFRDSSWYGSYVGRHPDAGTAGSKTVGLSAPGAQTYSIIAVEVKGAAGGGAAPVPAPIFNSQAIRRAANW